MSRDCILPRMRDIALAWREGGIGAVLRLLKNPFGAGIVELHDSTHPSLLMFELLALFRRDQTLNRLVVERDQLPKLLTHSEELRPDRAMKAFDRLIRWRRWLDEPGQKPREPIVSGDVTVRAWVSEGKVYLERSKEEADKDVMPETS